MRVRWITNHARTRMEQMGLDEEAVLSVVARPDLTMPNDPGYPPGHKFVARGITVVVTVDGAVLTVLWHGAFGRTSDGSAAWSPESAA